MSRPIWTPEALQDVQRCYRFLAPKSSSAATRAVRAIREGAEALAAHPGAGRPVDRMDPTFREWLIGFGDSGYVIFYRIAGERTVILAVRHQREAGYT